ncbi:MAG: hypothetical protein CMG97_15440 [Marinovum sp.]|nr:hypothetical protein [Marinovum sp.]
MFANNWLPIFILRPDFSQLECFLDGKPEHLQCFLTSSALLDGYLSIFFDHKRIVSANGVTPAPRKLLAV